MKKVSEPQILVGWLFGDKRPSGTVFHSDNAYRAVDNIDLNIVDLKVVPTDDVIARAGASVTWLIICIPISA